LAIGAPLVAARSSESILRTDMKNQRNPPEKGRDLRLIGFAGSQTGDFLDHIPQRRELDHHEKLCSAMRDCFFYLGYTASLSTPG